MEHNMNKTILFVALIAAILSPLALIWALNTLFSLNIAFGFFEWLSALILLGSFRQNIRIQPNK